MMGGAGEQTSLSQIGNASVVKCRATLQAVQTVTGSLRLPRTQGTLNVTPGRGDTKREICKASASCFRCSAKDSNTWAPVPDIKKHKRKHL